MRFPRPTQRPLNVCGHCKYSWYPRGKNLSIQCPNCGSRDVHISFLGAGLGILICVIVFVAFVVNGLSNKRSLDVKLDTVTPIEDRPRTRNETVAPSKKPRKESKPSVAVAPSSLEPKPVTTTLAPIAESVAITPPIRAHDAVEVAPAPRAYLWKVPDLTGYSSEWQKVGAIDVRIAGLSITKVPIIDGKERIVDSEFPMLVVIVEARKNTPGKKRTLRSFTRLGGQYGRVFDADLNEIPPANIPLDKKLNSGLPRTQPVPDDGTPVSDVLLFTVPADNAGNLDLRLDAERCDESGDVWFKIPALAWKKK